MSSSRPDTVAALVEVAAEAIRAANHRTLTPGQLLVPEVYTVLGDLSAFAWRLPQLHEQLARNLDHRLQAGGLRLDADGVVRFMPAMWTRMSIKYRPLRSIFFQAGLVLESFTIYNHKSMSLLPMTLSVDKNEASDAKPDFLPGIAPRLGRFGIWTNRGPGRLR